MSTEAPYLETDLGTTNSSMACFNTNTEQAEIIFNSESEPMIPSFVYYQRHEVLVGKPVDDI
jgi:molecular chaperone DnaK (HSP70)